MRLKGQSLIALKASATIVKKKRESRSSCLSSLKDLKRREGDPLIRVENEVEDKHSLNHPLHLVPKSNLPNM